MLKAQELWSELQGLTGRATGYTRAGILIPRDGKRSIECIERWQRIAPDFDIATEWLDPVQLTARIPGGAYAWTGGLLAPGDGYAEPEMATAAIAESARDRGASLLSNCAVRGIETGGGRVSGVVTERGRIACSSVVVAGGAWSHLLCARLGIDIPQLNVLSSVIRTSPVEGGPEPAIWHDNFGLRKRADRGYTVANASENIVDITPRCFRYMRAFFPAMLAEWRDLSFRFGTVFFHEALRPRRWELDEVSPFEKTRILDPKPSTRGALVALNAVKAAFPQFSGARIEQTWAGYIDVTPDAIPIISPADKVPGLFVATGFSGHGFGIAPGAGELMANLITGEQPVVAPDNFRLSRFR